MGCEVFVAGLVLAFLVGPFIGWIFLYRRLRETEAQLARLRGDLLSLRLDVSEIRGAPLRMTKAKPAPTPPETAKESPSPGPVLEPPRAEAAPAPPPAGEPTAPPAPAFEPKPRTELPRPELPRPEPPPTFRPPPSFPPPRRAESDWERWIGVRGAAVVGAVVLALAGLLFLKYSIDRGLLPPVVRVALGLVAGLACLVGSEGLRRRRERYEATANALAGAGIVLLYASVWAGRVLYDLIGPGLAFALMVLVTAACGVFSWRHRSQVVAALGLVGGFATPALLASGTDHPIGLFGYLLLLNLGVIVLAVRRGWIMLANLALALTTLYQIGWIFGRMSPETAWIGLGVLAVFAVYYAFAPRKMAGPEKIGREWELTEAAGVLLPFVFTFYFAGNANLGPHLYPLAALLVLLVLLAVWIGARQQWPTCGSAGAAAAVAAVTVWCWRAPLDVFPEWEAVVCGLAIALAVHLTWELGERRGSESAPERIAAAGFLVLFAALPLFVREPSIWPWIVAWSALAVLLWRQSIQPEAAYLRAGAALGVAIAAGSFFLVHDRRAPLAYALAAGAVCLIVALWRRESESRFWSELAAGIFPGLLLLLIWPSAARSTWVGWEFHAVVLTAGTLAVLAATRLASGQAYFGTLALVALNAWQWSFVTGLVPEPAALRTGLVAQGAAVLAFTAWPFLTGPVFRRKAWAWYAAALAGPAFFLPLLRLYKLLFGDATVGLLPLALAGVSIAAVFRSRDMWTSEDGLGKSRLAWFAAVALAFVSVAIPLQLDKQWITIGWALEGAAVLVLWRRLDHSGLKYFSLGLLVAAGVRLVANPAILDYYTRSGWPILNWLLYTYLVPAAAMLFSAKVLQPLEMQRLRPWEKDLYPRAWPLAAGLCGFMSIAVVFAWINLAVFDFFATGERLTVPLERLAARDLTLSLCWIAYGLVLLAVGMAKGTKSLRWVSLAVLMLSLAKVFLYDLGELEDLYRVASLVGLALSLLAVSLAYQRFVFGRSHVEEGG